MAASTIYLLGLLLPIALFAIWPLVVESEQIEPAVPEDPRARLQARKLSAYAAIKEAELDKRIGKLSDADYEDLVARYKDEAVEAIAALEQIADPPAGEGGRFCPACGTERAKGGKFCAGCGQALAA